MNSLQIHETMRGMLDCGEVTQAELLRAQCKAACSLASLRLVGAELWRQIDMLALETLKRRNPC